VFACEEPIFGDPVIIWYGTAVKVTLYFESISKRPDRAAIRTEWIERAIRQPVCEHVQADGRIRRWTQVAEMEGRYLRVILSVAGWRDSAQCVLRPWIQAMKIRYFADTDTLYIEFRDVPVSETRDLDENTTLDIDAQGDVSAITVEHASKRAGIPEFSYEQVTAPRA
jgi:uncharacterized protein YuzE